MKIRIEPQTSAEKLHQFLVDNAYENIDQWSTERLQAYALIVRLENDGATVGYLWGVWTDYFVVESLSFHACISKEYRGRWLTKSLVNDLFKLCEFLGAKIIFTSFPGATRHARLLTEILVRRFGFTKADNFVVYKQLEKLWASSPHLNHNQ